MRTQKRKKSAKAQKKRKSAKKKSQKKSPTARKSAYDFWVKQWAFLTCGFAKG
jgi:hypothetical protein